MTKTSHSTNLAADDLSIRIKQFFQLVIIESFCKVFDVNICELFSSIAHLIHSLSTRHEAANIAACTTTCTLVSIYYKIYLQWFDTVGWAA